MKNPQKFNPSKAAETLNEDNYTPGIYQVFLINRKLIIQNASYKPDIGLNLGAFKVYKKVLDGVFDGKQKVNASYPILDYSSMFVKRYYLIRSPDKKYLLQLGFAVDLFNPMKRIYGKILKEYEDLKNLEIYFVEKYRMERLDFNHRYHKKLPISKSFLVTKETFLNLLEEMGISKEFIANLKKRQAINMPKILDEIFQRRNNRVITMDFKRHRLKIFMIIRGVFNDADNRLIIQTDYSTVPLEKNIEAIKRRFLLTYMFLIIAIFIVYELIIYKVSEEIKEIVRRMQNNDPVEGDSFIYEIDALKSKYNLFREKLNSQLEKNRKLLEENKRFIVDTIHQIKTPLSIITLNIDFMKKEIKSEEEKEIMDEIEAAVTMLSNSYEDLSYIAGGGMLKYEATEDLNLSEFLKERITFCKTVAKANDKVIKTDIEESIFYRINKIEFERIVDNNISNAIKYSTGKEIFVSLKRKGDRIILRFESFGERIKNPDFVFEKSYREHSHKRGLGIGLNIVKTICDKYGIKYRVLYEEGKNVFEYIIIV
jgi:signal transduction histidine kinase